jgi:putative transposase
MSRPPRLSEDNYVGWRAYFLTICTAGRQPFFVDPVVVDLAWLQFLHTSEQYGCEITAYCFMPDHVHALVIGVEMDASVVQFVKMAKQRSGYWFTQSRQQPLWQEGYYDRVLRNDETIRKVIAYVIGNPLRAGLVERIEDYPFLGSAAYSREALIECAGQSRV